MVNDIPLELDRHWTVSVYVVHRGKTALHPHVKKGLWLPAGGHIEPGELPDEAARREALEETGLEVRLVDPLGDEASEATEPTATVPVRLIRPIGMQLANVAHLHEHIDVIYLAVPVDSPADAMPPLLDEFQWVNAAEAAALGAPADVVAWTERVTRESL